MCEACEIISELIAENEHQREELEREREARHRAESETKAYREILAQRDLEAYSQSIT